MKISLAQLNPTIGHFKETTETIKAAIDEAETKQSDLIIFPELCQSSIIDEIADPDCAIDSTFAFSLNTLTRTYGALFSIIT